MFFLSDFISHGFPFHDTEIMGKQEKLTVHLNFDQ